MEIKQKIEVLKTLDNMVLYRWTAVNNASRIAGNYILLSRLRLVSLMCDKGVVMLSMAAPVLYMVRGRPMIKLADTGVMTVSSGPREGINVLDWYDACNDNEELVPAQKVFNINLSTADTISKQVEHTVWSLVNSEQHACAMLVEPALYRISRRPETFKPFVTQTMLKVLNVGRDSSIESVNKAFVEHIDMFGNKTSDGYIIPNQYIATGGCCVASGSGITKKAGSVVMRMPLEMYRDELKKKHWTINTGEFDETQGDSKPCNGQQ